MQFERLLRTAYLAVAAAGIMAAADFPYIGKWILNPAKSDFAGTTKTFAQKTGGEMAVTDEGLTVTFKTDGKEYPSFFDTVTSWKQLDASTWETTTKIKGQPMSVDTTKISADGKTMTVESKGKRPNGDSFDDVTYYQRVSGGPGLAGKWKSTQKSLSPRNIELELAASGADGMTITWGEWKATCTAKFDGKDGPYTGPTIAAGYTAAFRKAGDRAFEMTEKDNGREHYKWVFTLSADGKTLTEVGAAVLTGEKIKLVYERQ